MQFLCQCLNCDHFAKHPENAVANHHWLLQLVGQGQHAGARTVPCDVVLAVGTHALGGFEVCREGVCSPMGGTKV